MIFFSKTNHHITHIAFVGGDYKWKNMMFKGNNSFHIAHKGI